MAEAKVKAEALAAIKAETQVKLDAIKAVKQEAAAKDAALAAAREELQHKQSAMAWAEEERRIRFTVTRLLNEAERMRDDAVKWAEEEQRLGLSAQQELSRKSAQLAVHAASCADLTAKSEAASKEISRLQSMLSAYEANPLCRAVHKAANFVRDFTRQKHT